MPRSIPDYDRATLYRLTTLRAVGGVYVIGDSIVEIAPYFGKIARLARFRWSEFVKRLHVGVHIEEIS